MRNVRAGMGRSRALSVDADREASARMLVLELLGSEEDGVYGFHMHFSNCLLAADGAGSSSSPSE